ncbi:hypothetical protein [Calothrix sp. UHCC 0171]|uniref:hypothetical protein n=1 Tax=Calothrix sp. UHCC 0171 TaxID=3110245 RepID=UPI002B1F6714|nr:hypothetical protein [Calothrix sp. UHCC 0171]MEA5571339.1 hypothetical protein [Calothrix sp. UHCC 0171]
MKKRKMIDKLNPSDDDQGVITKEITTSDSTSTLQLILYMIPIVGFFPSLWTLYSRQGTKEQLMASRLSITLAMAWILGYLMLATGAEQTSDFLTLRLQVLNTFLTSGYFLVSLWLILNAVRRKKQRLPGFSRFAERVLRKYTS